MAAQPWHHNTPTRPDGLTERQAEIVRYVALHVIGHGRPPTVRDVMRHFGMGSPNGVLCHLQALVKKGWLETRGEGYWHSYSVPGLRLVPEYEETEQGERLRALMNEESEG